MEKDNKNYMVVKCFDDNTERCVATLLSYEEAEDLKKYYENRRINVCYHCEIREM